MLRSAEKQGRRTLDLSDCGAFISPGLPMLTFANT